MLWAAHQVHHSSEYYNLSTALRQSFTQQFTAWVRPHFDQRRWWKVFPPTTFLYGIYPNLVLTPPTCCVTPLQIFYLPLALVAPPTTFAVHIQLNLLYQFWIHTEVPKINVSSGSTSVDLKVFFVLAFLKKLRASWQLRLLTRVS